jgi:hypothetical protein
MHYNIYLSMLYYIMISITSVIGYLLFIYVIIVGIYLTAYEFGYKSWKETNRPYLKMIFGIFTGCSIIAGGVVGISILTTIN